MGATPCLVEPIYSWDHYTGEELRDLRTDLTTHYPSENLREFFRGRLFLRNRGLKRFYEQLRTSDEWFSTDKNSLDPFHCCEYQDLFVVLYCVPFTELQPYTSDVLMGRVVCWRRRINK